MERRTILEMTKKAVTSLCREYPAVKEEVLKIVGGKVLDYEGKSIYLAGIKVGRQEGRQEGIQEEKQNTIKILVSLVRDQILTIEEAARRMGMSTETFREKAGML